MCRCSRFGYRCSEQEPSADPSTRQSKRSKAMSKDEGGNQQRARGPAIGTPQNNPHKNPGSNAESRAQPHQDSSSVSAVKPKRRKCFRISSVPRTWKKRELLKVLKSSNDSLDLTTGQYQLSLYPACSGSSQTALLSIPGNLWNLERHGRKLIVMEHSDLVMDRHFYGLTPLNNPGGEIVAE